MRKLTSVLIIFFSILLLSACSNSDSDSSEKLQFYVSGDTIEGSAITKMSEKYTEETGVEVEVVDIPYSDMITKITNMVRSGEPPALARVTKFNPVWEGKLMDLTDIAAENNVDIEAGVSVEGELVAPPLDLTAVGIFINKDLFDQAGVSYPTSEDDVWTWEEYLESIQTILDKTDARYGMVMDNSEHRLNAFMYQFGSKGFYEENGEYVTNPETKVAIENFIELNDNKVMPKSVWTSGEDASSLFKSGKVAAYMSGSWQITDFAKNIKDFEWVSVYMPYEEVRATNLGGNYIVGFEGSGQEEETKEFIDWLYQKENYEEMATFGGYMPVIEEADIEYEHRNDAYDIYRNEIAASDPIANEQRSEQVVKSLTAKKAANDVIQEEVMKVINDEQTVDAAIENIKELLTEAYVE